MLQDKNRKMHAGEKWIGSERAQFYATSYKELLVAVRTDSAGSHVCSIITKNPTTED